MNIRSNFLSRGSESITSLASPSIKVMRSSSLLRLKFCRQMSAKWSNFSMVTTSPPLGSALAMYIAETPMKAPISSTRLALASRISSCRKRSATGFEPISSTVNLSEVTRSSSS